MLNSLVGIIASSGGAAGGGSYESIASATGTGSSGTITFSSIPSTYVALQLRCLMRSTASGTSSTYITVRPNSSASFTNANHELYGDGTSVVAQSNNGTYITFNSCVARATATAGKMGVALIDIHNYASTTQNKTFRAFTGYEGNDGNTNGVVELQSALFIDTTAISSLRIDLPSGSFTTDTVIALYGIKGA